VIGIHQRSPSWGKDDILATLNKLLHDAAWRAAPFLADLFDRLRSLRATRFFSRADFFSASFPL